jgi:hypothetical protein
MNSCALLREGRGARVAMLDAAQAHAVAGALELPIAWQQPALGTAWQVQRHTVAADARRGELSVAVLAVPGPDAGAPVLTRQRT